MPVRFEKSSGNVFADIGLPDAEERMIKAELSLRLSRAIRARGLTQVDAARALGISRDKAGHLVRCERTEFSAEQLARFLEVVAPVLIPPRYGGLRGKASGTALRRT